VRCDLGPLGDDLIGSLDQRRAADSEGSRAVGTETELDLIGVAEHDLDLVGRDRQLLRNDLRKGRLVTLSMVVGANQHRHVAGDMDPHRCTLEDAGARAERLHDARWRQAAGLDIGAKSDATQLAARLGVLLAFREAVPVGDLQRLARQALGSPLS